MADAWYTLLYIGIPSSSWVVGQSYCSKMNTNVIYKVLSCNYTFTSPVFIGPDRSIDFLQRERERKQESTIGVSQDTQLPMHTNKHTHSFALSVQSVSRKNKFNKWLPGRNPEPMCHDRQWTDRNIRLYHPICQWGPFNCLQKTIPILRR